MKQFTIYLAAAVWAVGPVVAARGSEALLKAIPDDALGVVVVNHLAETAKKIEGIGAKINAPLPTLLPLVKTITGLTAGVDEQGDMAAAVIPQDDAEEPPTLIIYVPVTDYAQLVAGIRPDDDTAEIVSGRVAGQAVLVTRKGDYALFARPTDEAALKRVKAATSSIASEVKPLADWLRENDVVALALPKGVRKALDVMQQGIEKAKEKVPADQDSLKPELAIFQLLDRCGDQIKQEVTHAALGVQIDRKKDLLLSLRLAFKQGGSFSQAIADARWPQTAGLDDLPDEDYFLATNFALPSSWVHGLMDAAKQMAKLGVHSPGRPSSEEQIDELFKLSDKSMQGVRGWAMSMAPPDDEAGIFKSANVIMYVDDAERHLKNYLETMKAMADLSGKMPNMPTYDFTEIQVAGKRGFKVGIDMAAAFKAQLGNNAAAATMFQKLSEILYGPEGKITVYLAPANEHAIAATYADKDTLEDLIKSIKKGEAGLGKDDEIVATGKLLPAGSAGKMFISPAGTIDLVNWIIDKVANGRDTLPEFPDTPPLAAGVKFDSVGVEARLALPSALIDGIGDYVLKIREMRKQ